MGADRSGSGWVLREVDTPARYVGHRCAEQVGPLVSCKRKQKARDIGRDGCGRGFAHAIGLVVGDEILDTCTAAEAT